MVRVEPVPYLVGAVRGLSGLLDGFDELGMRQAVEKGERRHCINRPVARAGQALPASSAGIAGWTGAETALCAGMARR